MKRSALKKQLSILLLSTIAVLNCQKRNNPSTPSQEYQEPTQKTLLDDILKESSNTTSSEDISPSLKKELARIKENLKMKLDVFCHKDSKLQNYFQAMENADLTENENIKQKKGIWFIRLLSSEPKSNERESDPLKTYNEQKSITESFKKLLKLSKKELFSIILKSKVKSERIESIQSNLNTKILHNSELLHKIYLLENQIQKVVDANNQRLSDLLKSEQEEKNILEKLTSELQDQSTQIKSNETLILSRKEIIESINQTTKTIEQELFIDQEKLSEKSSELKKIRDESDSEQSKINEMNRMFEKLESQKKLLVQENSMAIGDQFTQDSDSTKISEDIAKTERKIRINQTRYKSIKSKLERINLDLAKAEKETEELISRIQLSQTTLSNKLEEKKLIMSEIDKLTLSILSSREFITNVDPSINHNKVSSIEKSLAQLKQEIIKTDESNASQLEKLRGAQKSAHAEVISLQNLLHSEKISTPQGDAEDIDVYNLRSWWSRNITEPQNLLEQKTNEILALHPDDNSLFQMKNLILRLLYIQQRFTQMLDNATLSKEYIPKNQNILEDLANQCHELDAPLHAIERTLDATKTEITQWMNIARKYNIADYEEIFFDYLTRRRNLRGARSSLFQQESLEELKIKEKFSEFADRCQNI